MPKAPPVHRAAGWKPHEQQRKESGKSSTQRGYGYKWQQFRAGHLKQHPLCVHCEREGRLVLATDLDHVVPHRGDPDKFWSGPFQGLCASCHSKKTANGE